MYVTLLERLIEPILLDKICKVEIRELVEKNHYDLILMVPKSLISVLIGKKGSTIRALSTIIESKAYLENNTIKLVINEF
ncbi:KH domain-containing protein [Spiroplasma endosymbiont of Villa modesta]|uniref:KH domain-containing protein n=1 Tax=Spiroplasma endosymbiont of Villa modesta TaxID=3066293 RepID=UPI00313AB45D